MPFSTRLSSTRGTPRGLLGSSGSITHHSKSVRSYRLMPTLNQMQALQGRAIVAELAQISNARTMISRRTTAGYGLGLAATAAIVLFIAPLDYGLLISMSLLGSKAGPLQSSPIIVSSRHLIHFWVHRFSAHLQQAP